MEYTESIEKAKDHFGNIVKEQLERVDLMKKGQDWIDYSELSPIIAIRCWTCSATGSLGVSFGIRKLIVAATHSTANKKPMRLST